MNKKTGLLTLLTLAICLSACTPAAPEPTGEAPVTATAETATAETTATAMTVGTLRSLEDGNDTGKALYVRWVETQAEHYGDQRATFLEIDYTTARQRVLSEIQVPDYQLQQCFVQGDTFFYTTIDEKEAMALHSYSLTDGTQQSLPLAKNFLTGYMDETYLYLFPIGYNEYTVMQQLDPRTGTIREVSLPGETINICDGADGRFLIERLISEVPVYSLPDEEQRNAALQNASVEYAWWNPADGSVEPVLREPYFGDMAETGLPQYSWYLGRVGDTLYFYRADETGENYQNCRVERCGPNGSNTERILSMKDGEGFPAAFKQNGEIRWLVYNAGDEQFIYCLADETQYEVPTQTAEEIINLRALTDDGRVLLVKSDRSLEREATYCLVPEMDYLAGNFTGTDVTPVESNGEETA